VPKTTQQYCGDLVLGWGV